MPRANLPPPPEIDQTVIEAATTIRSLPDAAAFDENVRAIVQRCSGQSYVFITCANAPSGEEYLRFFVGCNPKWFHQYKSRHGYLNDPLLAHAKHCSLPLAGSTLARGPLSTGQSNLLALAQQFGFKSLIALPSHGPGAQSIGLLCIGSDQPGEAAENALMAHAASLRLLALEMLEWVNVHARVKFVEKCEIDASDITVLQHALKGHTSADIALLTNTTACAVDERFRRLCARMQVRNRKAAITLAYLHGAVF